MQVNILNILQGSSPGGTMEKTTNVNKSDAGADFMAHMTRSIQERDGDADYAGRIAARKAMSTDRDAHRTAAKSVKRETCPSAPDTGSRVNQRSGKSMQAAQKSAEKNDPVKDKDVKSSSGISAVKDSSQDDSQSANDAIPSSTADSSDVQAVPATSAEAGDYANPGGYALPANSQTSDPASAGFTSGSAPNYWQGVQGNPPENIRDDEDNASAIIINNLMESQDAAATGKSAKATSAVIVNTSGSIPIPKELRETAGTESGEDQFAHAFLQASSVETEGESASGTASENADADHSSMSDPNSKHDIWNTPAAEEGDAAAGLKNQKHDTRKTNTVESGFWENKHVEESQSVKETASLRSGQSMLRGPESAPAEAPVLQNRLEDRSQTNAFQSVFSAMRPVNSGSSIGSTSAQITTAQSKEFILQVADHIQVQVRNGKGEIRIQLRPESLGHMEIKAESSASGVVAKITTESNEVRSYLENNMHVLQQSLQDQGLKVDRIEFAVQNGFENFHSSGNNAQSGHTGAGSNGGAMKNGSQDAGGLIESQIEDGVSDAMTRIALNPNIHFHTVA